MIILSRMVEQARTHVLLKDDEATEELDTELQVGLETVLRNIELSAVLSSRNIRSKG